MTLTELKTQVDNLITKLECNMCHDGSTIEDLKDSLKEEAEVTSNLITEIEELKERVVVLEA